MAHAKDWRETKPLVNNTRRDFRKLCKAVDIPIDAFHSLRKSYCTNLLEGGIAPHAVQKIMGHSSVETTIKYYSKVRKSQITAAREISKRT
jgi:site-specific recombinase XerD